MRILIFHGYLLRGTGSNIYNANLARALAGLGHEVHLFCQDRTAQEWEGVTIHVPDIGRVLPVYVADRYEGFDALPFPELDEAALGHYLDVNVAAVRSVPSPDIALANHLVMGPVILSRGLEGRAPYAVKIHGSALEYTVRQHRERFLPYALEGIRGASGVLVGSRHTAESLWEVLSDEPSLPERTRLGPPGVDAHSFRPRPRTEATIGLTRLADKLGSGETAGWGGEAGAAEALRKLDLSRDRIVSYVGKLIVSKGVDLLLAAWPLVVARVAEARLVVVGFGTYREALGRFVDALGRRDLETLREIAARGREFEGGPPGELKYLRAFLESAGQGWLSAAPVAAARSMRSSSSPPKTRKCGKVKLFKLLYFLDFEHFKATGRSVTGLDYFAWQMGPVPAALFDEIETPQPDMASALRFQERVVRQGRQTMLDITPQIPFSPTHFSRRGSCTSWRNWRKNIATPSRRT